MLANLLWHLRRRSGFSSSNWRSRRPELKLYPQSPAMRTREQLSRICPSWSSAYSYYVSCLYTAPLLPAPCPLFAVTGPCTCCQHALPETTWACTRAHGGRACAADTGLCTWSLEHSAHRRTGMESKLAGKHLIGAIVCVFRTSEELRICVAYSIHGQVSKCENSHHAVSLSSDWMPRAAEDGGGVAVGARQAKLCLASPSPLPSTCAACTCQRTQLVYCLCVL